MRSSCRAAIWSTERRRRQAVAEVPPMNWPAEAHVLTVTLVSVEVTVDKTVFVEVLARRKLKKLLKKNRPSLWSKSEKSARPKTCSFKPSDGLFSSLPSARSSSN